MKTTLKEKHKLKLSFPWLNCLYIPPCELGLMGVEQMECKSSICPDKQH